MLLCSFTDFASVSQLSFFFERCAETLTRWATLEMFDTYNTHFNNYYVFDDKDAGTTTVTHRLHEDVHVIDKHFRCTIDTRRCWQQSYTGVLCIHSLMAVISRICISPTTEAKASVCRSALGACHSNWHRTTYSCFEDPKLLGGVPQIKEVVQPEKCNPDIWRRFRDAAAFVPQEIIKQMIMKIEVMALRPHTPSPRSEREDTPGTPERILYARKSDVQRTLFSTSHTTESQQPATSNTTETQQTFRPGFFTTSYPVTNMPSTNFFGRDTSCINSQPTRACDTLVLSTESPLPDFQNQQRRSKGTSSKRRGQANKMSTKRPKQRKRKANRGSFAVI